MASPEEKKAMRQCRYYENEFPEIDALVMVQVTKVAETNAYVSLLEYNNMEGMILLSEVSTRRIRSMLKEIRVGQFCVCRVLKTDEEKGYIDLSRRRVTAQERGPFLNTYTKSKLVHSTLMQLCANFNIPMTELCRTISWPLYKKFGHAKDGFSQYVNDGDASIFSELEIKKEVMDAMLAIIKKKLTPQAMKLKAKVEVKCFEYAGIDAVKAALRAGQDDPEYNEAADKEAGVCKKIQIKVIAPPQYDVYTQTMSREDGLRRVNAALDRIKEAIEKEGGEFVLRAKPEVVGDEGAEEEEEEVKDDDDGSDEEEDQTMGDIDIEGA